MDFSTVLVSTESLNLFLFTNLRKVQWLHCLDILYIYILNRRKDVPVSFPFYGDLLTQIVREGRGRTKMTSKSSPSNVGEQQRFNKPTTSNTL